MSSEIIPPECKNCEDPICRAACPADAVYKNPETGLVEHDDERCVACNMCVMVCPFGAVKHTEHGNSGRKGAGNATEGDPDLYEEQRRRQRSKRRALALRLCLEGLQLRRGTDNSSGQ